MTAAFDTLAATYDDVWTRSEVGRSQRNAVWAHVDPLFKPGDSILDLGCGTGEDALHFASLGLRVKAVDQSAEMVRVARSRGVDASVLSIEQIGGIDGPFDGVISNFGALNCVSDLSLPLGRLIRRGGTLAICLIGRFCAWETAWYLAHGQPRKAVRRWSGESYSRSLGISVYYPSFRTVLKSFEHHFELRSWTGIGLSYVKGTRLPDALDRRLAALPFLRACADHRLFVFTRK